MSTNPTTAPTQLSSSPGHGDPADPADPDADGSRRPRAVAANVVRGALIGVAETVPGVSGGTVALVSGIYGRLIGSVKHVLDIPRMLVTRGDWRASGRQVDWWLLIPVCLGMAVTVFSIAGVMESFVTDQPVASRALFMGMIAMSVVVPFLEIENGALSRRPARLRAVGVFAAAAAVAFALTSLPRSEIVDPPLILTFGAAAIAVCALVLPGVSGSFFLLVVGMYAPTLAAVDAMDIRYLAVFALGALVGLMSFVRALEWLLANHHTLAMVAAAGLLSGSLRALWPWQTDDGGLLGVGDDWPVALLLLTVGAAVVAVVALVQRRLYTADASAADAEHREARYSGAP
ncbi:DUF368 domain-containing protein [Gordonia sp. DT218]|uniref:DUF368 domain-containing protein n=1 Tax=Gordonia sp. DT218 TaxID=3416659 RepID=UPI003CEA5CA0